MHNVPASATDRPIRGLCPTCGNGFTARTRNAIQCYPCWSNGHSTQTVADPRAAARQIGRVHERSLDTWIPAAPSDTWPGKLPRNPDGTVPAERANKRLAVTRRLAATIRQRQAAEHDRLQAMRWINAIAYDLHHTDVVL